MNDPLMIAALDAVIIATNLHREAVIKVGATRADSEPVFREAAKKSYALSEAASQTFGAEAFTAALMLRLEAEFKAAA